MLGAAAEAAAALLGRKPMQAVAIRTVSKRFLMGCSGRWREDLAEPELYTTVLGQVNSKAALVLGRP